MNYYTWYDVKHRLEQVRIGEEQHPQEWQDWSIYHDELVIETLDITPEFEQNSDEFFKSIFGHRYNENEKNITLDYNQRKLDVIFEKVENAKFTPPFIPSFKGKKLDASLPDKLNGVPIIAFHSYKGGVGRTLSLLSFMRSFLKDDKRKVLIIDGDIEAPGLTWLAENSGFPTSVSLLDAFSILHETENWREHALPFIASKIQEGTLRIPLDGAYTEQYFLPAYRYVDQVYQNAVLPETIITMRNRSWIIADFLSELGKLLGVDAVIVDLRAGFSEISSPFLFDNRVKKVFVSSTSLQSRKGLQSILNEVYKPYISNSTEISLPKILITMVPEDLNDEIIISEFSTALTALSNSSVTGEMLTLEDSYIKEIECVPFFSTLIHLEDFESIDRKLAIPQMDELFNRIVADLFIEEDVALDISTKGSKSREEFLRELKSWAFKMHTAESSPMFDFLSTNALKNITKKFKVSVPNTVVLGAKGAGKTFAYLQILHSMYWESFVSKIEDVSTINPPRNTSETLIVPIIRSKNASDTVTTAISKQIDLINTETSYKMDAIKIAANNQISDAIEEMLDKSPTKAEWRRFWIDCFLESTGMPFKSLIDLHYDLESKQKRLVFMIDGLEEIFTRVVRDRDQKNAVTALSQAVISEIQSIPDSRVGLLLFLRRDVALNSIEQNWTQFYNSYAAYELKWSRVEALQLVLWLCRKVDNNFGDRQFRSLLPIENWTYERLEAELVPLWGKKLGKDSSREANSAKWILSALSDLNDQLQARDMMRFLTNATEGSLNASSSLTDRYIYPESIRKAITPCSEAKITELTQEIPNLENIFSKLREEREGKQIPFDIEEYNLTSEEVRLLEQQGFLIQFGSEGYYMPEIIRLGLGFKLERGARPKVVALLNRAKSRI